jgi:hypothetical protein
LKAIMLLFVGYPMALAVLLRLRPVLAERRVWWFAALQAGMASIVVGWWLRGQPVGVVVNGAVLVGLGVAWWIAGRRPHRTACRWE